MRRRPVRGGNIGPGHIAQGDFQRLDVQRDGTVPGKNEGQHATRIRSGGPFDIEERQHHLFRRAVDALIARLPKAELDVCLEKINKSVSGTYFERWLATLSGQLETRTDNSDDNDIVLRASHLSSEVAPTT